MKYCTNCGAELKEGSEFCPKCGTKIGAKKPVSNGAVVNGGVQPKSKMAAGLLGIFLGCFGVHNFYLGFTGKAIAQLLISVLSCFILSPVSAIWGLIEGILILSGSMNVDAEGNPLGE
jgi:hypothetical protein